MSSPPFPSPPPFKFGDLKKYLHLEMNGYSMIRENTNLNIEYQNMTDRERNEEIKTIEKQLIGKSYIISDNKYPYWLDDGMIHKIIWVSSEYEKYIFPEKIAIEHLLKNGYRDFVLFFNSKHLKSVPSITHYHVIYLE